MSVGFGLVLVGCGGWVVGGGCLGRFHEGMACWSICLLELYTYLHQISFSKFLTIESIDLLLFSSNNRLIKGFVTRISYNVSDKRVAHASDWPTFTRTELDKAL
jgi:hypothetical protein